MYSVSNISFIFRFKMSHYQTWSVPSMCSVYSRVP